MPFKKTNQMDYLIKLIKFLNLKRKLRPCFTKNFNHVLTQKFIIGSD